MKIFYLLIFIIFSQSVYADNSKKATVFHSVISLELDGSVSFILRTGDLKKQLTALLVNHPNIKGFDHVVWNVDTKKQVKPITESKKYTGVTIDHVIQNVLRDHSLVGYEYHNGFIVIESQTAGSMTK